MLQTPFVQVQLFVLIYVHCVLVSKTGPIQLYLFLLPLDGLAEIFSQLLHPLVPHDNFLLVKLHFFFRKKMQLKKKKHI